MSANWSCRKSSPESPFDILDAVSARSEKYSTFQFVLAGSVVRVHAETARLQEHLVGALEHRVASAAEEPPDLTILAWETQPTPLTWAPAEWNVPDRWALREPVRASGKDGMFYFDPIGGTVTLYDSGRCLGGAWFSNGAKVPLWTVAAPFLRLLDAWFTDRGKMLCHGAAIAKHGGAALLVGPGGAGKSTLALRALDASFGYLGDDYVLLDPAAPRPVVHSVYSSGKLLGGDVDGGIPSHATVFRKPDEQTDKALLRIGASSMLESAPLLAVIEPCIGENERPRMEPISAAETLRTVLPAALRQLPGEEQKKLSIITRVVTVPCFRLHLTRDHARNLAVIGDHLRAETQRLGLMPCTMRG
jgi:hypothetical protein